MDHLLYVLWHDHWRPWILNKLEWLGYVVIASVVTSVIFCGLIWMTIEIDSALRGWM